MFRTYPAPDRLAQLLDYAANAAQRPVDDFKSYFGLSADVWRASTQMSLEAAFGAHADLALAPPAGPGTNGHLGRLSHFINCHGASINPNFFGQQGSSFPIALTSAQVAAQAAAGSVIAAECCYGAQLYDPALAATDPPICVAYLGRGALGFLGSTTIAYGPADSNGQADLLTQYFFENVLSGASLGRALLQARVRFVTAQTMTDPSNLKTLAQFLLLGDPSIAPCQAEPGDPVVKELAAMNSPIDEAAQRKVRRIALASSGAAIADGKAVPSGPGEASETVKERVRGLAEARGFKDAKEAVLAIRTGSDYQAAMKANSLQETVMVVSTEEIVEAEGAKPHKIYRHIVAQLIGDGIASIREIVSR